jgi:2-keto-3-deoxy-galactonokinase
LILKCYKSQDVIITIPQCGTHSKWMDASDEQSIIPTDLYEEKDEEEDEFS